MSSRVFATALCVLLMSCSDDGASEGSDTSESTGSTQTDGDGDGDSGDGDGDSGDGDGDSGDGDGDMFPECVSDNPITAHDFSIDPPPLEDWTRTCTVIGVHEFNRNFTLDCPTDELEEDVYVLHTLASSDSDMGELPLAVDQTVTLIADPPESLDTGTTFAWAVRDEQQRLLVASYFGQQLPGQGPEPDPALMTPLSFETAAQLCPTICEEPGLGVPPECLCEEALALLVFASPEAEPIRILDGNAGAIEGGKLAVETAIHRSECLSDDKEQFTLLYVADPA